MTCTAIVVTYNSAGEIERCLDSLAAQEGVRVDLVVVDNASVDRTVEIVRDRHPRAQITENPVNVGFARAVNQGLARVDPESPAVFLVNPDTVTSPGTFRACLDVLAGDPAVAVVGPRLVHPDGSLHPSCHGFLGLRNLLGEAVGIDHLLPVSPWGSLHLRAFRHDRVADVDWIQGAFLAVRTAAIREVGPLSSDYFMYGEEMDWCLRMKQAGYRVRFLPWPEVMHVGGASSRPLAGPMFVEVQKSRLRFVRKHRTRAVAAVAPAFMALGIGLRLAFWEVGGAVLAGRSERQGETVRLRRRMMRAAAGWVLRGCPLDPFVAAPAARP